jgi:hypothetical protein
MPNSGHRKLLKAASTRSGRAIHTMSTAKRGKTPAKDREQTAHLALPSRSAGHPDIYPAGACSSRRRRPTDRGSLAATLGRPGVRGITRKG